MAEGDAVEGATAPEPAPEPERRHGTLVTESRGQAVLHPTRDEVVDLVRTLRDDEGYWMCLDVCGVDYLGYGAPRDVPGDVEPERFEVVYLLINHRDRSRLRIRVQVPAHDAVVPTMFEVHPGTEAPEREVFDMFGIAFAGHPDLTRILMPEDWDGHPLRKDYGIGAIPVQFKGVGTTA